MGERRKEEQDALAQYGRTLSQRINRRKMQWIQNKQRVQELQQIGPSSVVFSTEKRLKRVSKSGSGMHSSFSGSMDEVIEEDKV